MPNLIERLARRTLRRRRDTIEQWSRILSGDIRVGAGTKLAQANLLARDPQGCSLSIGSESNIEASLVFEKRSVHIDIGSRTHLGGGTLLDAACRIEIADDVLVAFGVLIMDHDSHSLRFSERRDDVRAWLKGEKDWTHVPMRPVKVSDKAWIGANVIILKGTTIGEGAVIAAGSVVTSDVPDWTIAGGNPARVIRELTEEERSIE